ncbi:MAG: DUF2934 domain-containing protein [Candidatus Korobacteraceae bacterium]
MNNTPFSFRRIALDQGSVELTEEYIRLRAYQIYEQRGRQAGHDVDDWLQAETEILGKKPNASEDQKEKESEFGVANAAA